jgi:UDP-N-acetylglucosamine 4,6-dehydratase/5-epimerase
MGLWDKITAKNMLNKKSILITAGASWLGKQFVEYLVKHFKLAKLVILDRDEDRLTELQRQYAQDQFEYFRFFVGDIHDRARLQRAFDGVDIVIHIGGMHIPAVAEYNPFEAVKSNIIGVTNIIEAAIDRKVDQVVALSNVSSYSPATLVGLTKATAERLFIAGNSYAGKQGTNFIVARIPSFIGIYDDLAMRFQAMKVTGVISITDPKRTRFFMTSEDTMVFMLQCLKNTIRGEIFIPKLPAIKDIEVARELAPDCEIKITGISPSKVVHEVLMTSYDSQFALEYDHYFRIVPFYLDIGKNVYLGTTEGIPCHSGFRYSSEINGNRLTGFGNNGLNS